MFCTLLDNRIRLYHIWKEILAYKQVTSSHLCGSFVWIWICSNLQRLSLIGICWCLLMVNDLHFRSNILTQNQNQRAAFRDYLILNLIGLLPICFQASSHCVCILHHGYVDIFRWVWYLFGRWFYQRNNSCCLRSGNLDYDHIISWRSMPLICFIYYFQDPFYFLFHMFYLSFFNSFFTKFR